MPRPQPAARVALPLYQQIASAIERQIDAGLFAAGQRIYSIRKICQTFGVGDVTAKRALRLLKQRGVIQAVVGSGAYVRQSRSRPEAAPAPRRGNVGLIKFSPALKPIFQYELDLIQQQLQPLGHPLITATAAGVAELPGAVAHLLDSGVGCLVVLPLQGKGARSASALAPLRNTGLPLLLLETPSAWDDCVTTDIPHAAALLVEHLRQLGHQRICLISDYQPKIDGYRTALPRRPDGSTPEHVVRCTADHYPQMVEQVQQVLTGRPRPTAIIACNDRMAEVVIQQCDRLGLRIPKDLSLATFDDHPALSVQSAVAMTVVRHPSLEIAQEVARWAHERLRGQPAPGHFHRSITGSLIVRDSTGPASDS